jgi:UDP-glucose 4-epimerase
MRILVAGGAGYIGSCTTEYLLDHGHQVTVFDALITGHRAAVDPRADFIHGNLNDDLALDAAFQRARPEGIIHFAAFIEVGESMRRPGKYFANNIGAGIHLLEAAVRHQVRKVVFSSTAAVYGLPERNPIPDGAPVAPINPYGESKLTFERILHWYHTIHGLQYAALRYFNAAGATARHGEDHNPESHLIPLVIQAAMGVRPSVSIFGDDYDTPDGSCIRDYVHVTDLAQAHLLALESNQSRAFNLGSGNGHSVKAVMAAVTQITGRDFKVTSAPRRPGDPARLVSDSTDARAILGWQPAFDDLHTIVESAWRWRRQHPHGYAE